MQTELPFFFLCMLIHISIFLSSPRQDKKLRLMLGMAILFLTPSLWYAGEVMYINAAPLQHWLGYGLRLAPYYLPLASFSVYAIKRDFS